MNINIKKLFKIKNKWNRVIVVCSALLLYLIISLYFTSHFFFNTQVNGVDVSLKSYSDVNNIIKTYAKNYKLELIERNGEVQYIIGQEIELDYNPKNSLLNIYLNKKPFKWIISLFKNQKYYVDDLYKYNKDSLDNKINKLNCLNKDITEPKNPSFKYSHRSYEVVDEVYGNKVIKKNLDEVIRMSILKGETKLDLDKNLCYENPKYTSDCDKTLETKNLLDKYVSTKITYAFGNQKQVLDGDVISKWVSVDKNLDVIINKVPVNLYVHELSRKYDTVGTTRKFNTSIGKIVEVSGGLYGWKINCDEEVKELFKNIKHGKIIEKEPVYVQKAVARGEKEIGDTYVEINITRQHLWFYKKGKLVTQGAIVTGDPNRGNATELGVYMLNYKQKGANLVGTTYETEVSYWMPFFGNIGIHDATWRYSFGGDIYKKNGSHGCVNTPLHLAKKIFENIDEGTPIVCYEE